MLNDNSELINWKLQQWRHSEIVSDWLTDFVVNDSVMLMLSAFTTHWHVIHANLRPFLMFGFPGTIDVSDAVNET